MTQDDHSGGGISTDAVLHQLGHQCIRFLTACRGGARDAEDDSTLHHAIRLEHLHVHSEARWKPFEHRVHGRCGTHRCLDGWQRFAHHGVEHLSKALVEFLSIRSQLANPRHAASRFQLLLLRAGDHEHLPISSRGDHVEKFVGDLPAGHTPAILEFFERLDLLFVLDGIKSIRSLLEGRGKITFSGEIGAIESGKDSLHQEIVLLPFQDRFHASCQFHGSATEPGQCLVPFIEQCLPCFMPLHP